MDASHTSKGDFHHGPNTLITTLPVASANDEKNIIISGGEEIVTIGPLDSAATAVHVDDNGEVFSIFTVGQKRALVLATSFVAWLSPLSAAIYYPVLTQVCNVTIIMIKLRLTGIRLAIVSAFRVRRLILLSQCIW